MPTRKTSPQAVEQRFAPLPPSAEERSLPDRRPAGAARRSGSRFAVLARTAAWLTGRPATFAVALLFVAVWAVLGPIFHWSDTWQLVINTSTTIVTFLMIFLLQSSQNRDAEAVQLKLDELIRAIAEARNSMLMVEEADEDERAEMKRDFDALAGRTSSGVIRPPRR